MFTTGVDNQTAVDIHVLQGERELVADNRSLARFKLRGIPPMPAGMPRVQVQFQIDANGILSVTARELRTEHRADDRSQAVVRADRRGSRADAARFVRARRGRFRGAAAHRGEERSRVGRSRRPRSRSGRPSSRRSPKTELAAGEQKRIEQALAGLKHVLNSSDREAIQQWTHVLNDATQHLAEIMMNRSVQAALSGKSIDEL